jgi:ATP-binding cassette subfamily A (ABC1) protein 3
MFANFLTGLCLMIVSFVLSTISSTQSLAVDLRYLFRLFPAFCLGDGLTQLALCDSGTSCPSIGRNGYDFDNTVSPFSWNIVGANLVFLAVEAVVYFLLTLLVEYSLTFPTFLSFLQRVQDSGFDKDKELPSEDEDVYAERCRVQEGGADGDVVKLHELRKVYNSRVGPKVAVQSLSFGIPRGECFGFLGINGAGKTTTLSILSGEFPPTAGDAYIDGFSIKEDQTKIRKKIGYCPQFDALLELLTVREHLELYARIKCIPPSRLAGVVDAKIKQMDLRDFEHKAAGTLSGGNKRKLSVAIAMIGDPSIIFLDEPSTGMDPVARRFMWEVISRISTQDALCSIILTTHSMEEAEALCTRIGIMVNGRLQCLGSSQHLKLRFGNGYEIDVKMKQPAEKSLDGLCRALEAAGLGGEDSSLTDDSGHGGRKDEEQALGGSGGGGIATYTTTQQYKYTRLTGSLSGLCEALLEPDRVQLMAPGRDGEALFTAFEMDGFVTMQAFLEWWVAQDQVSQWWSGWKWLARMLLA